MTSRRQNVEHGGLARAPSIIRDLGADRDGIPHAAAEKRGETNTQVKGRSVQHVACVGWQKKKIDQRQVK